MTKQKTQEKIILLPIGSFFTLNGVVYKKMDNYYATKGIKNFVGYIKKVKFNDLNIKNRANELTISTE
jgi:hypothetical protein